MLTTVRDKGVYFVFLFLFFLTPTITVWKLPPPLKLFLNFPLKSLHIHRFKAVATAIVHSI